MSRPTVRDLESSLKSLVRNWDSFGRNLPGIDQADINIIECDKKGYVESQKVALYDKWLKVYPNASWDDVVRALREADETTLAQTVENKLASTDMAFSTKQLTFENETVPSSPSVDPVQQGEVYDMPESVVDELKELHDTFVPLAANVKDKIKSRVDKGEVKVESLVGYTEEQRAFPIENHTTPINDSQTFLSAIKPHYNFLNPYLLVMLAIHFLSNSYIAQRAKDYRSEVIAFNKSTSVRALINTLKRYRDHLRPTTNNRIVTIRINNSCFNQKLTIWVVRMLIQTLFPIMHPDEVPWYEVCQGSLVLSFIATDNMLLPFIVSCARKMEFMRLLGIVSVSIGNVYMVVNRNTEPFSLENNLIEATVSGNVEAVKFLLKYLKVNPNVKCKDKRLLQGLGMDLQPHNQIAECLMLYENAFADLVLDIKKEIKGDDDSDVAQVINSYYEQLQRQHNFLNTALLSSQSSHLSKDLQQRIKQHCEGIEEIKREAKLHELELKRHIPDSQLKDRGFFPVSLTLCSNWVSCGMHNVEQLIKLVFPSVALEHFQWFRISDNYHFREIFIIKFLVPKNLKQTLIDSCKLEEKIAHGLGVFMIEIDDTLAFRGRYDMIYGYHFQKGLQIIKHHKNEEAIDLLEQIIKKKLIGTSWCIIDKDVNNNCSFFILDPDSTPLMIACRNDNEELVQLLLKYNADPNICSARNITALLYSTNNPTIFHMLLDHGADSGIIATSIRLTALHLACMVGNLKIVETMIERHPNFIDLADMMGRTPLWFASEGGHLRVVKRFLHEKVNPNVADIDQVTPLLIALYNNFVSVANALLKAKANPNCQDKYDESTPLLLATSRNNLQLVEKLLNMNANPNMINSRGESPLWKACVIGNLELVEKLLQAKADVNLHNSRIENIMPQPYYTTTTPLYGASEKGHLNIVNRLLEGKADPNLSSGVGLTPLMGAAFGGSVEVAKRLLQARANPHIRRKFDGETALGIACSFGHMLIIDLLLRLKVDPNIQSLQESTPLWRACFNGNVLVVERLLQEPNIVPDLPNVNGDTPLLIASANGHIKIVIQLLQALADPSIRNNLGETPLMGAIHGRHWLVVNKLLECKTNLNISSSDRQTPLLLAVSQVNLELVKKLLKMNANPNVLNNRGESPLWIASVMGHTELVEILLRAKANPNLYNQHDRNESEIPEPFYTTTTPLYAACSGGHLNVVSRLLEEKADPNLCSRKGLTPLMGAAFIGSVEITERLLQAQADPNIQRESNTALGMACDQRHVPVIDVLLLAKANPNIPNEDNAVSPLYRACFKGDISVVERLLQEPNIALNIQAKHNGDTPLLAASGNGHDEIVELLLETHASPNIPNNHGETPLLAAVSMGHWAIVEQLLEYEADPNISSKSGATPLLVAVQHRYSPIIIKLLQANADPTSLTLDLQQQL